MKGLAQFVMRGRLQALLIAVAGAGSLLFCWISAAVIALVTLRKGAMDGVSLLFWALLPAGTLWFLFGDSGPLALLLGTTILALVLRETVSLPLAVLAGVGVGVATGLVTLFIDGELVAQLVAYFDELLAQWEAQLSQGEEAVILPRPDARQVAGLLGAGTATLSVLCMMLARYWQAQLYNPDGFGLEFRAPALPADGHLGIGGRGPGVEWPWITDAYVGGDIFYPLNVRRFGPGTCPCSKAGFRE